MPLTLITEAPAFIHPDSEAPTERATPATFVGLPPVLRTLLEGTTALLDPGLPSQDSAAAASSFHAQGTLFVTNDALAFLDPASSKGFSVDFPTISLHAVSRTIPAQLQSLAQASGSTACLYCQLDDHAGDEDDGETGSHDTGAEDDAMNEEEENAEGEGQGADGEEAEDASGGIRELWLLPQQPDQYGSGHPFAGLGPFGTGGGGDDDDGGMLGVGGPVLDLSALSAQGAFDDAMEGSVDGSVAEAHPNGHVRPVNGAAGESGPGADGLSDTGRAVLARLEGSIQWPDDTPAVNVAEPASEAPSQATTSAGNNSSKEEKKSTIPVTNTLILTSLPESLFQAPELLSSLLDLLHAYGPLQSWTPLPSMGRALVVFEDGIVDPNRIATEPSQGQRSAKRAKEALDKLLWGFEDEDRGADQPSEGLEDQQEYMEWPPKKAEGKDARDGSAMRVYFGPPSAVLLASNSGDALAVPSTDKNFLISPPGSPPIGWEPIKEDPPNRDTLAWDLIKALGELRDQGGAVDSWKAAPLRDGFEGEEESRECGGRASPTLVPPQEERKERQRSHARKGSLGPPSFVLAPSEAKVSRRLAGSAGTTQPRPTPFMDQIAKAEREQQNQKLEDATNISAPPSPDHDAKLRGEQGHTDEDSHVVTISVPGVTVQAFEDESDEDGKEAEARRRARQARPGLSISSVKATVESMISGSSASPNLVPSVTTGLGGLLVDEEGESSGGNNQKRITPTSRPPLSGL
ncbi:hypothetical protein OC845_001690 [Tilletia horrida]|nr:hypothetical protein OC845_001690 [Tilletia horrida]